MKAVTASVLLAVTVWLPLPSPEVARTMPHTDKAIQCIQCIRATNILVLIRTRRFGLIWSAKQGRATVATEARPLKKTRNDLSMGFLPTRFVIRVGRL